MPKRKSRPEDVLAAVAEVRKGVPVAEAARRHNVPRTTVWSRLGAEDPTKGACGPAPVLGDHETVLVNWIYDCARAGFPKRKEDILDSVQELVQELKLENPFIGGRPRDGFYRAFMKRHPDLAQRTPEAVSYASACVAEADIRSWFSNVEDILKQEDGNLTDILKDPTRVLNGDETSFMLCPKKGLVVAPKGMKDVYEVDPGTAKENVTCMFSFSAAGEMVPPMMVFPYQRIPRDVIDKIPSEWTVGRSDSGWMTSEVFYEYISVGLNSFLTTNNVKRPVILFVDGHKTHLTIQTSKLCKSLDIVLVALYPNATRILQPADVAAFRPLKIGWSEAVRQWRRDNLHGVLTKAHVAPLLHSILQNKDMSETLRNGFRATGLFPWNPDAIDFSKCLGAKNDSGLTETSQGSMEKKVITPQKFLEILGQDKIKILQTMKVQPESTEEPASSTQVLLKLWKLLGEPDFPAVAEEPNADPDDPAPQPGCSNDEAGPAQAAKLLTWPEPPKRKGKRETERMPYVLTSQRWREMAEEKERKRKAEEEAKEERKRVREEKKKENEEKNAKRREETAKKQAEKAARGGGRGQRGAAGGRKKK